MPSYYSLYIHNRELHDKYRTGLRQDDSAPYNFVSKDKVVTPLGLTNGCLAPLSRALSYLWKIQDGVPMPQKGDATIYLELKGYKKAFKKVNTPHISLTYSQWIGYMYDHLGWKYHIKDGIPSKSAMLREDMVGFDVATMNQQLFAGFVTDLRVMYEGIEMRDNFLTGLRRYKPYGYTHYSFILAYGLAPLIYNSDNKSIHDHSQTFIPSNVAIGALNAIGKPFVLKSEFTGIKHGSGQNDLFNHRGFSYYGETPLAYFTDATCEKRSDFNRIWTLLHKNTKSLVVTPKEVIQNNNLLSSGKDIKPKSKTKIKIALDDWADINRGTYATSN